MSPSIAITESSEHRLSLSQREADALVQMGRRLAGRQAWWGAGLTKPDQINRASAITVRPAANGAFDVRVNEAIGVIRVGAWDIVVQPKIPTRHLLFLLEQGGSIPRLDPTPTGIGAGVSLWSLVAHWLLDCAEAVLRRDLVSEYQGRVDVLPFARGRVNVLPAAVNFARGRVALPCSFDELTSDNPLNRVLVAGIAAVARSSQLTDETRLRASRIERHFEGVSPYQPQDLRVQVDSRTWYYRDALQLAKCVLANTARDLRFGPESGWTFLLRTPEAVERGIREVLARGLEGEYAVKKKGLQLAGSTKSLNPDLVFDSGAAVADVKYKLQGHEWSNTDLYQVVAFATGFHAKRCAVLNFTTGRASHAPLQVGDVVISNLCWTADEGQAPEAAAMQFVADARDWLRA